MKNTGREGIVNNTRKLLKKPDINLSNPEYNKLPNNPDLKSNKKVLYGDKGNDKQVLDETIEKFLIKTRTQYRKGRVYTFKDWIKIVRELLDELD